MNAAKLAAFAVVAAFASATASVRADDPSPAPTAANQVAVSSSTSLLALAKAAATKYGLQNTGITVVVSSVDSGDAMRALGAGTVDVALTDQGPGAGSLLDHRIAVLPFAFVTNRADGVSSLTVEQIAGILTGKITNWNEIGGANVAVKVVNRGANSGVTRLLQSKFLAGKPATAADTVAFATGTALDEVKRTPGAVSVVTTSAARDANASVTSLAIEGATPRRSARRRRIVSALGVRTRGYGGRAVDDHVAFFEPP